MYTLVLRPRLVRWGASDEEVARPFPGQLEGFFNFWVYPPVHWPMQVRQFANIKRNAESDQLTRRGPG